MPRAFCLAVAIIVCLHVLAAAQNEAVNVQLFASGASQHIEVAPHRRLARSEVREEPKESGVIENGKVDAPGLGLSPLQIGASVSAKSTQALPWPVTPLCQFEAEGDFKSLVRVFVNTDNTRAFVFDSDAKGAQTKVQCHGATPGHCLKPHLLATGMPPSCDQYECGCMQTTMSLETIHLNYVKSMVHKIGPLCTAHGGANILHIGLGGGAMSSYLLDNCAHGTRVTSVEKDPRIIAMAKKFFGLRVEPGKHEVENLDASAAVQAHAKAGDRYDAVLIDCFESHGHVPESCTSQAFVQGVRNILKPEGISVQQVWASQYSDLFHTYNGVFGHEHLSAEPVDSDLNYLLVAKST